MTNLSKQKVIECLDQMQKVLDEGKYSPGFLAGGGSVIDMMRIEIKSGRLNIDPPPQAHSTIYEQSKKYGERE